MAEHCLRKGRGVVTELKKTEEIRGCTSCGQASLLAAAEKTKGANERKQGEFGDMLPKKGKEGKESRETNIQRQENVISM